MGKGKNGKNNGDEDYDSDDETITKDLGVNLGRAYCTECQTWYDVATQSDKHAH